jgi:hypothetical protein
MNEDKMLPVRVLHEFVDKLEELQIDYMLSGSMALLLFSIYRFTADIDIVIDLTERDSTKLINFLEPDYYVPHNAVRQAVTSRSMFNIIDQKTAFKIDCVMTNPERFQRSAFGRRKRMDFYGKEIFVITPEDLVISKLLWAKDSHSEKQLTDVRNLLRNQMDTDYIEKWALELGLSGLLNETKTDNEGYAGRN